REAPRESAALVLVVDGSHCVLTRYGAIFELCLPVCPANALFTSGLLRETTPSLKSLYFRNQLFVGLVTHHGQPRLFQAIGCAPAVRELRSQVQRCAPLPCLVHEPARQQRLWH